MFGNNREVGGVMAGKYQDTWSLMKGHQCDDEGKGESLLSDQPADSNQILLGRQVGAGGLPN